jgi:predicted nucleic acid-binding protein
LNVFADTSGWAHFAVRKESAHAEAVDHIRKVCDSGGRLVTTSYVLAELTAILTSPIRLPRVTQIDFLKAIRTADWVEVVHIDPVLEAAAWQLWESRPDKDWSLVDCSSFAVMQTRGLTATLTGDHHFEQAGFAALLRGSPA